jgi:hypothetical protein
MSSGGIFVLLTNDGKQDHMLMATNFLRQRLADIREARAAKGLDPTPTLADIEKSHVLFMHAHFKPFAALGYEYNKVRTTAGTVTLGSDIQFSIPQFGDLFHDMCLHVVLGAPAWSGSTGSTTKASGAWVDYPGERLLSKVSFEVNGNPLDEYTSDAYVMHRNFHVDKSKATGWKRCMGQQVAHRAVWDRSETADANLDGHSYELEYFNGPQTKRDYDAMQGLELFAPLLFWFNKDPRLAIPSVSIPFGQRFLNVQLNSAANMVEQTQRESGEQGTGLSIAVSTCELYINNIFVNPEVHDIFIQRIGFSLIRVHRRQVSQLDTSTSEVLLQAIKWPVESLYVGFRPTTNTGAKTWDKFSSVTSSRVALPDVAASAAVDTALAAVEGALAELETFFDGTALNGDEELSDVAVATAGEASTVTPHVCAPIVDNLSITAHGVPIYNDFPAEFFNAYQPYHFGGYNITTPDDCGLYMINFCLYPGTYQPSGHLNVSRARELYIKVTSSTIDSGTPADMVVYARCINFLLISDGSAVLRYTT